MNKNRFLPIRLLALLMAVIWTVGAVAQPYRANRQQLCIEGGRFAVKAPVSNTNYLYVENFTINPGETKTVPVYLHSTVPIWMMQADVVASTGLTVNGMSLSSAFNALSCASQYDFDCGQVSTGYRLLLFNNTKTLSVPTSSKLHIFNLTVTAGSAYAGQTLSLALNHFLFVNANDNEGYQGADRSCTVTVEDDNVPVTGVTMSPTTATLAVGATQQLTATVTPSNATNPALTWTSSNASVATVSSTGKVTAKAPGTATITATTKDGTNLSASCVVTVTQPVTGVSVSPTTATLTVGDTQQLTATVTPSNATNPALTWTSSNASVATVSSTGKVTAKAAGTATITATTKDGTNLSASCVVTVTQPVTGVTVSPTSTTLAVGATQQLTATVTPSNATNPALTWTSSNASVATVSSTGKVTAKAAGTATITATTKDGTNLSASCVVTVEEAGVLAVAIDVLPAATTIKVGQTATLTALVQPDDVTNPNVTWRSSNATVATVSSAGVVTAKAVGYATITATTTDGTNLSASCAVTVVPNDGLEGDVDGNGKVDIDDVNALLNIMLGYKQPSDYEGNANVDGDPNNKIDIDDVNKLINIILAN